MHRLNLYKASVYIVVWLLCYWSYWTRRCMYTLDSARVKTLIKTCPERSRRHWFTDSALGRVESRCIQCVKHILWNAKHGWAYFFDRRWVIPQLLKLIVREYPGDVPGNQRWSTMNYWPLLLRIRSGVLGTMEELVVFGQSWVNVSVTSLLPDLASNCGGWLDTRRSIWNRLWIR